MTFKLMLGMFKSLLWQENEQKALKTGVAVRLVTSETGVPVIRCVITLA